MIIFLLLLRTYGYAQLITSDPALPLDNQPVTIYFDASKGNQGLINYVTGDVYAHTGVLTDKSTSNSDWKYVKAAWNINIPSCKLTRIDATHYSLSITPAIRDFYGVPAGEKILKLAFVFRSPDGKSTGRDVGSADIFYQVYQSGLNVSFALPASKFSIVNNNQYVKIQANAILNDSITLFLDGQRIFSQMGQSLIDSVLATGTARHMLVATVYKMPLTASDTVYYLVPASVQNVPRPAGARDGINYVDSQTVTFVLYAPFKKYVYLIGDFNDWMPDNNYLMKNDSSRYWITLDGLTSGKEYACQYLIDGNLRIADPYSEKILDPWNDKYIPERIYPGLMPYPTGKTTEIAGVVQPGQAPFSWQVSSFSAPPKNNLVIYELLIRDFTDNQDIKTVTDTLQYFKRLGINAIELMPISEFEGNDSWGYNPDFYFAPDKAYGIKNDYKKFIDECHKNGIAVIQDMVLNHSYGQSPLVRMYFDGTKPTAQNPWYNQVSPNPIYSWGYDFNHASPATQYFVDRVTSYWLNEFKIDGFRFDFTKGFTNTSGDGYAYDASRIAILKRMVKAIWNIKPNAYVILEHFTDNTEELELSNYGMMLWGNLNCAYNQGTMGYSTGSCTWNLGWISYLARGWSNPNLVAYMESHDEERLMYKNLTYGNSSGSYNIKIIVTALSRMELASCFFYTIPGPKMLWQFGEMGYDVTINAGGDRTAKKPILWNYLNDSYRHHLFDLTAELIRLKLTEPVFSTNNYTLDVTGAVKKIDLTDGLTEVHIVGNFDVVSNPASVHFSSTGKWWDYLAGDSVNILALDYPLILQPGQFKLFTNKRFPGFRSVIASTPLPYFQDNLVVYPNPANEELTFDNPGSLQSVEITSLEGKPVLRQALSDNNILDISSLKNGIYFLTIYARNGERWVKKIVKQ